MIYEPQFNHLTQITDPLSHSVGFAYDGSGNLLSETDGLNHSNTFGSNSLGQITSITDAVNDQMQFAYAGGDLLSATDPLGQVSSQITDAVGRPTSATDTQGNSVKMVYDQVGRVLRLTDAQGNDTNFSYDLNGNLLSITDPLNHTTSWTYDNMDRVTTRTDALNRQSTFTYDPNGNLLSSTDRKGQTTVFGYDALNRRTSVGFGATQVGGNVSYESTISFTYDSDNNLLQAVDSAGGTITRTYDNFNRLTGETTSQGSVDYGYDAAGRRTSMTVSGQPNVTYSYDNANRLTQIAQGAVNVTFAYDDANRRSSLSLPNGVVVTYSYDSKSRVTGITYKFAGNVLGDLTYSYDSRGLRTQVGGSFARTGLPAQVASASYDSANELISWNGANLSYDANGNMVSDGSNLFTWNARNQVSAVNGNAVQYDAAGRRTRNSAGRSFLLSGSNTVQEIATTPVANVLTGGTDEVFQRSDNNGTVTPLTDALGSTVALVDGTGAIATAYTYEPYGNTSASGAPSSNPNQYAGRENEGNGLYYYRARYYSPVLGRFISEDPKGFKAGVNFYAYVNDSPINFSDPFGLDKSGGGYGAECGDPQTACDSHGNCLFGECMPVPDPPTPTTPACEDVLSAAECQWVAGQQGGDGKPFDTSQLGDTNPPGGDPPLPPTLSVTDCTTTSVALGYGGMALDAAGMIPGGGNVVKGVQLGAGVLGLGISWYQHDKLGQAMGWAGLGLGIADLVVKDGPKAIPVLGNVLSGVSLARDGAKTAGEVLNCQYGPE